MLRYRVQLHFCEAVLGWFWTLDGLTYSDGPVNTEGAQRTKRGAG